MIRHYIKISRRFSPKIWIQQSLFLIDILIRNYLEINAKVPFLDSCNVHDSTKDGRLTTAQALSSPRPSVLGRGFNYRTRRDKLMNIHRCVVSSQYVRTRMTIPVLLVHELIALGKNNSKGHNSYNLCCVFTKL